MQYERDMSVDLKDYMQCVFDPHDKLDEIAVVVRWASAWVAVSIALMKRSRPRFIGGLSQAACAH